MHMSEGTFSEVETQMFFWYGRYGVIFVYLETEIKSTLTIKNSFVFSKIKIIRTGDFI